MQVIEQYKAAGQTSEQDTKAREPGLKFRTGHHAYREDIGQRTPVILKYHIIKTEKKRYMQK